MSYEQATPTLMFFSNMKEARVNKKWMNKKKLERFKQKDIEQGETDHKWMNSTKCSSSFVETKGRDDGKKVLVTLAH